MVFALETYCPASDGVIGCAHRGGDRGQPTTDPRSSLIFQRRTYDCQRVIGEQHGHHHCCFGTHQLRNEVGHVPQAKSPCASSRRRAYDMSLGESGQGHQSLSLDQEAIAVGFATAMKKGDWTFATYGATRTRSRAAAVPMTPGAGRTPGPHQWINGRKGGSMHLTSVEHGVMGSYAIIARAPAHRVAGTARETPCNRGEPIRWPWLLRRRIGPNIGGHSTRP